MESNRHEAGLMGWGLIPKSLQEQPVRVYTVGSRESWKVFEQHKIIMKLVFKEVKLSGVFKAKNTLERID